MNRSSQIIKVSSIGIAVNVLLASFKAIVGIASHSIAIVMDAVNNLSDALSSIITIVGIKLSERPADYKHPFGHGRIEYFSAIVIAIIVLFAGLSSLVESVKKIINPTEPDYTKTTLIIIIIAIITKLFLGTYVKKQGENLKSDALIASGSDALFDAIITASTLVSASIMLLFNFSLDGFLGAIISLVIIKAGIEMLSSPVNELLGARISSEFTAQIKKEVSSFDGVHGVFDIILHNYGPNLMIGSLHINVLDSMTANEIHGLTRDISVYMHEKHGIIMTVGIYAVATKDSKRKDLQTIVMNTLSNHKEIIQVHGFYYYENRNMITVDIIPNMDVKNDAAFAEIITKELSEKIPDCKISVVIDHNYCE